MDGDYYEEKHHQDCIDAENGRWPTKRVTGEIAAAKCSPEGDKLRIHELIEINERFGLVIRKWQCKHCGANNYSEEKLPESTQK